jgi:hypothetical protein
LPPARNPSITPAALKEEDRLHSDSRIKQVFYKPADRKSGFCLMDWLFARISTEMHRLIVRIHAGLPGAAPGDLLPPGADLLPVTVDHAIPGAAIYDALNIE